MARTFQFSKYSSAIAPQLSLLEVRLAILPMALRPMMPLMAKLVWFLDNNHQLGSLFKAEQKEM